MSAPFEQRIWGKHHDLDRPYPLGCHCIDAAAMAETLWDTYLTARQRHVIATGWQLSHAQTRHLLAFLAALHDLGKITPGFQSCEPAADQLTGLAGYEAADPHATKISHQRATHLALPDLLGRVHDLPLTGRPTAMVAHQLAQILGGHHGTYLTALTHQGSQLTCPLAAAPALGDQSWDKQREVLIHLAHDVFGTPKLPDRPAPAPVAVITTGLVILADWLVSQTHYVRARQDEWDTDATSDWKAHAHRARRAVPALLDEAQLTAPAWRPIRGFQEMFPHLRDHTPHPIQTSIAETLPALATGPGLLLITGPPGEGKTEAALYAERVMSLAAGTGGFAFLLPTMATTDAMWTRIRTHLRTACHTPTPVTLLHALAWLDADYTPADLSSLTADPAAVAEWLRGRHRGFLAAAAVGTWDQAALAALPHRFMALRWLGLSGKTVIIDEVHAYDAHGHALTLRLLQWLGALGAPVILLSATVTGDTAAALIRAYRDGAGHTDTPEITPNYPGWVYTDHTTGTVTTSEQLGSHRAHTLTVEPIDCVHDHDPDQSESRAHAILDQLTPLARTHTGCALIVCNTVDDAQATRQLLTQHWGTGRSTPLVRILHARLPARQRAAITRRLTRWTGPRGKRPTRPFVIITTQVAEQSLDVDFDLVISDLAPLALLLQRAGRGHRHHRTDRPTWADAPRLVVLIPTGTLPPKRWGSVYSPSLLRRTRDLLDDLQGQPIEVPGDVQHLIDTVYGPEYAGHDDWARLADDAVRAAKADLASIDAPAMIHDLYPLTNSDQHPDLIATRLGADGIRILPTYTTSDGRHWLHPTCHTERTALPRRIDPGDRSTIRRLMHATIPINSQWLAGRGPDTDPPPNWSAIPVLRDLILLPQSIEHTSESINPYHSPAATLHIDREIGLVRINTRHH